MYFILKGESETSTCEKNKTGSRKIEYKEWAREREVDEDEAWTLGVHSEGKETVEKLSVTRVMDVFVKDTSEDFVVKFAVCLSG